MRSSPAKPRSRACFGWACRTAVYAEISAVRRRNLIEGETMPVARLLAVAPEFGLTAKRAASIGRGWCDPPVQPSADALAARQRQRRDPDGGAARAGAATPRRSRSPTRCIATARCSSWRVPNSNAPGAPGSLIILTPLPPRQGGPELRLFLVHLEAVRRARSDARRRRRRLDDAPDRAVGADLLSDVWSTRWCRTRRFATLYTITAGVGVLILFDGGFNYCAITCWRSSPANSTTPSPPTRSTIC